MIQFYSKYKQFKALVDAKDYENVVRSERHTMIAVFASSTISVRLSTSDWWMLILISLIDKQIKHHTYEYKRLVNDEYFDQLNSMFRFEELVYQPCNRRITDVSELRQVEELWLYRG